MDPDWLPFHPNPSTPTFQLPPGSVDAHCHVFGPAGLFPFAPERRYTPCDASRRQLFALRDRLGFARNVVVQATCHGADNRAVVVDHMGRPDVTRPADGPEFERFVRLLHQHENIWSKVSCPERVSVSGPPALNGERNAYRDVVPFARRLVETFPDRVLWGTDWPHPNLKHHMPDDGLLVDFVPQIAITEELQRKLLVDNPMRLYWAD